MLVVGVFLCEELKSLPYNVSKKDQNNIFPKHMGLYKTEYNFDAILDKMML